MENSSAFWVHIRQTGDPCLAVDRRWIATACTTTGGVVGYGATREDALEALRHKLRTIQASRTLQASGIPIRAR